MLVSVSFINSNYPEKLTIQKINDSKADYLHIDIMDGKFVPVKNYEYSDIKKWLTSIHKPLDIHLMVDDVIKYIDEFSYLNPQYITFHLEATKDAFKIINYLHNKNIKVGLAINPITKIEKIIPYLNDIDLVLIMSVKPGYGGQKFIEKVIPKINYLNEIKDQYHYVVSVDGGINAESVKLFTADMVVSGSYICKSDNYDLKIASLK